MSSLLPFFKDQWILAVSDLTFSIKQKFKEDSDMQDVWVRGEISNLTNHRSGHSYFTLKDAKSQIQCVMFKWYAKRLKFKPSPGMKVIVFGSVEIYEQRSQYQIQVMTIRPDGIGELYKAFEQLKIKLEAEGLFSEVHKKPLPKYPLTIAVASSPTGAVIHDIINITRRRYPVHIILAPTLVQGAEARESIVKSIQLLNQMNVDVIILARGGGSIEDLWPFNEEEVARAIYHSEIPIVSAIGHETDYTIADFTADLRAPTPSAAAELTVPDVSDIRQQLSQYDVILDHTIKEKISGISQRIAQYESIVSIKRLDERVNIKQQRMKEMNKHLQRLMHHKIDITNSHFDSVYTYLNAVSPLHTIKRGYSITLKGKTIVSSITQIKKGDNIEIMVKDGMIESTVNAKNKREVV
ncbi:MAG: Exodeoxyribonuclease 7 large subunit [Candidatus Argoarchaeum ethanivorans]|uniref:Exodeoxyribonuclease 7 large subunit n=1 Tax=Candidatus Argoarchaeum ethanivorans TaxID=2608793 RepID=A0A811T771_9EURY|nr:MAG: Exodeoxyribonuclease 7 large subunit [Candidatus Argoarchaeum ethanivorans]